MTTFELEAVGGPWARRLAPRRAALDALPWAEVASGFTPEAIERARWVWTQSAFSEVASAAAFAQIASAALAAGAPIDLVAAAGEFVADEMVHAELSARVAMALGGAVHLDADLDRLARPPACGTALMRAAELVIRACCVGEALTVPVLASAREGAGGVVASVLERILRDEVHHAELGWWFLDWAGPRLSDADRVQLGAIAADAVRDFAPLFAPQPCDGPALGALDCATFDPAFAVAVHDRVQKPLEARGISVATT